MSESSLPGINRNIWPLAVVVVAGAIMSILDTTIVNVAIETLSVDLKSPIGSVQWVVTGYMLALAAVIPVTGWAARRLGTRRLYLISLVLFTLGSLLCGFAWSTNSLIAFRILQGLGGGMLMPTGMIILARAAGPDRMGRILSIVGVPMVLAPVFGPVTGGLLVEHFGWRWIFFINIPVGIVAVALAWKLLPVGRAEAAGKLDVPGLVLLATGLPALTYGLAKAGSGAGFGSVQALGPIAVGIAADRRLRRPLAAVGEPVAQRAALRQPRVRGSLGDHILPRRIALRRHDPAAALLPGRARRLGRAHRPAARAAEPRRGFRDAVRRASWPTATAVARSRSPG